jgi:hypothetical protein
MSIKRLFRRDRQAQRGRRVRAVTAEIKAAVATMQRGVDAGGQCMACDSPAVGAGVWAFDGRYARYIAVGLPKGTNRLVIFAACASCGEHPERIGDALLERQRVRLARRLAGDPGDGPLPEDHPLHRRYLDWYASVDPHTCDLDRITNQIGKAA